MGLKAFYESMDEVPEALRDHYTEDKGKFVLAVDDIDDHPKVRGVITANRENIRKRDEYKAKAAEAEAKLAEIPEDFDAEKWVSLNANANGDDPAKKDEQLQSMKAVYEGKLANLQKKYETDMAARAAELQERDGYIDSTVRDGGLKDSLLAVGVNPDLIDGAIASLRNSVKVQRADDGSRKAIVETDLGEIGVTDFVKDWAQTKGKAYLAPPTGHAPNGNDGQRRGVKTPAGDFGGNKAERVKALNSKFPELAAQ
jgi:hypothetical protein